MPANETDATDRIEGTDYVKNVDYHREVHYSKQHADGRTTQVLIEGRWGEWDVKITDIRGDRELARCNLGAPDAETREAEKELAEKWMQLNPEGLAV